MLIHWTFCHIRSNRVYTMVALLVLAGWFMAEE